VGSGQNLSLDDRGLKSCPTGKLGIIVVELLLLFGFVDVV
jgi:hypothetical protein